MAHPSKAGLVFGLAVLAATACHKDAVVTTRVVTAYTPAACALGASAYAEYFGYGDFEPPAGELSGQLFSAAGTQLPEIGAATRTLVVTATGSPGSWEGVTAVPPTGGVNVLLTPALASCPLSTSVGARTGAVVAPIGNEEVLVVGGTGDPVPATYVARLDTGAVTSLGANDLNTPRTDATVTAFGPGALVAGGTYEGQALGTAEVYSSSAGGFDPSLMVTLSGPRTQHGAVTMASGRTLLVGGLGSTDSSDVLGSMEIVDPSLDKSIAEGVATLATPRRNPTVMLLASGEILVAGGFDGSGNPVQTLEWFNPDATPSTKQPLTLAQGKQRAFMALEQGGALAVVPPDTPTPGYQNAWVIDATGAPDTVTPIQAALSAPALFGGAGGAPILWTGSTWLRWQPYAGAFGALDELDDVPPNIGSATASPDPGLAMWLDTTTDALLLLRFDTTNAYSSLTDATASVSGALLANDTTDTAPDRLGGVSFDPESGLTLQSGSPAPAVFVTDRTYADVQMSVSTTNGVLPLVVLRDNAGNELDVPAGPDCTAMPAGAASSITVTREDRSVTFTMSPSGSGTCSTPWASGTRLSVGVRGQPTAVSTATDWVVTRLGEP